MAYFIIRECACGRNDRKEMTQERFESEVEQDLGGCVSVDGEDDTLTYQVHSCTVCRAEQDEYEEEKEEVKGLVRHACGYCGSEKPLIPYEEMYGPGAVGYDCCPDCGGV